MSKRICIIDGVRTPFAKAGGPLKDVPAYELARVVVRELLDRHGGGKMSVDAVILGNIIGPPEASNIARVVALQAGLPDTTAAYTVNMNCASGMLALTQGCDLITQGRAKVVIAGGTESMSQAPLHFPKSMTTFLERWMRAKKLGQKISTLASLRPSLFKPVITLTQGLTDPISGLIMGDTAEVLAKRYGISRAEQDTYALRSHQTYFQALENGFYADHLLPIFMPPKYQDVLKEDVGPRANLTLEQLAKLKPYFDKRFGTVTVGNSCPITDGAAACLLMEEEHARALGLQPRMVVRGFGYRGIAPEIMGLGPAVSAPIALKNAGVSMRDIDLFEINEAFAVQILANLRLFESPKLFQEVAGEASSLLAPLPLEKLNAHGGAIALGHPVGTSGARIVINLCKGMMRRQIKLGMASICVGGGLGGAMIIEQVDA